jgi:hypothetical protein
MAADCLRLLAVLSADHKAGPACQVLQTAALGWLTHMHLRCLLSLFHRYGDNIRSSWSNVLELVLRLDKLDLLPPALEALIDADVWGVGPPGAPSPSKLAPGQLAAAHTTGLEAALGSAAADANDASTAAGAVGVQQGTDAAAAAAAGQQQPGAAAPASPAVSRPLQSARQRRAAAGASGSRGRSGGVGVGGAFLRSVTQLMALQEPEYEAKYATQVSVHKQKVPAVATYTLDQIGCIVWVRCLRLGVVPLYLVWRVLFSVESIHLYPPPINTGRYLADPFLVHDGEWLLTQLHFGGVCRCVGVRSQAAAAASRHIPFSPRVFFCWVRD